MTSIKFNDENININNTNNKNSNIYDLNIFTNENYYNTDDNKNLGMYYNNNFCNNNRFNNIIKSKIINKIKREYNKKTEELNITDNNDFIKINFPYNDCLINVSFCKKNKMVPKAYS